MATVGLRDLYYAPITEGAGGVETYGAPVRLAKAISVDMSVETAEAFLFADDSVDEAERQFVKGTIKMNINDLTPNISAVLLGQTQDKDKVVYAGEEDDPPYVALGFRAKKTKGLYKYIWLYKVKFAIPSEKYQTKDDKLNFQTPEIEGTFIKRDDGLWKSDHVALPEDTVAQTWFTAVREPNVA